MEWLIVLFYEMVEKARDKTVDILKGVLIIFVVMGHCPIVGNQIIYWFHMPCFFMVAGFFIKRNTSKFDLQKDIKSKAQRLLIPYSSYLILFTLVLFLIEKTSVLHLLLYGRHEGIYAAFWFVPVLFLSHLFVSYFYYFFQKFHQLVLILLIMYAIAHIESYLLSAYDIKVYVPFGVDICLISTTYLFIGHLLYTHRGKYSLLTLLFSFFCISFLLMNVLSGDENYHLDMKYAQYPNFLYDMIIPIAFMVILYAFSVYIKKTAYISSVLSFIGKGSLSILFLHIPILTALSYVVKSSFNYNVIAIVLGVLIPVIINYFFNKTVITRFLFIGDWGSKPYQST